MVKEYIPQQQNFYIGDNVDCIDERGVWLNGEVLELKPDAIFVKYSGYHNKFNRWVPNNPSHILTQWRRGNDFKINNRIDVLDTKSEWREAQLIEINDTQIKVHYRNFTSSWDEWISKNSDRISEIGSKSKAYGIGKVDPSRQGSVVRKEVQPFISKAEPPSNRERTFRNLLLEKDLIIVDVESDGNCLFRAVSHQLYGTTEHHGIIRRYVYDYMSIEREYFSQFIVGGLEGFDEYLRYQTQNGAWGDDCEIQAISEIYNRPVEIYAYANTPMRTFHENEGEGRPMKLAYHGQSHYNSITSKDKHTPLIDASPGSVEATAIQRARSGIDRIDRDLLNAIRISREGFENRDQLNLQQALEASMQAEEDPHLNAAISQSLNTASEEDLIRMAMEHSLQHNDDDLQAAIAQSIQGSVNDQDLIEEAIRRSQMEFSGIGYNPFIDQVVQLGFTQEQAFQAYSIVGDNTEAMIDFIMANLL
jgi:OTU domain-containing protein 5